MGSIHVYKKRRLRCLTRGSTRVSEPAPLPPSHPRLRAPRSATTPRHKPPAQSPRHKPQGTNPKALTAGARRARVPLRAAAGRRQEKRGGRLSPCPPSACSSQPGSPELRLEHGRHLPALLPARGRRCPAEGRGNAADAAWARGEGPSAASSSPALRDGGRRPWRPLPGAAPVALPEAVPEGFGPRVGPGSTADGGLQLSGCHFKSVNNCKDWIS